MARDEALLTRRADDGSAVLRFYSWSDATLSLGYFQKFSDRLLHSASLGCATIRRASGGGAIVHDHELTYSFLWPATGKLAMPAQELYLALHETLVTALYEFGVSTQLCDIPNQRPATEQPFLCFERRAVGDVLLNDYKVAGSAQRRSKSSVLQHGSVLLRSSRCAPELLGIQELTGKSILAQELIAVWTAQLASRINLSLETGTLSDEELLEARMAETEKFAVRAWTEKR